MSDFLSQMNVDEIKKGSAVNMVSRTVLIKIPLNTILNSKAVEITIQNQRDDLNARTLKKNIGLKTRREIHSPNHFMGTWVKSHRCNIHLGFDLFLITKSVQNCIEWIDDKQACYPQES